MEMACGREDKEASYHMYACSACLTHVTANELGSHTSRCLPPVFQYMCNYCQTIFDSLDAYIVHATTEGHVPFIVTAQCDPDRWALLLAALNMSLITVPVSTDHSDWRSLVSEKKLSSVLVDDSERPLTLGNTALFPCSKDQTCIPVSLRESVFPGPLLSSGDSQPKKLPQVSPAPLQLDVVNSATLASSERNISGSDICHAKASIQVVSPMSKNLLKKAAKKSNVPSVVCVSKVRRAAPRTQSRGSSAKSKSMSSLPKKLLPLPTLDGQLVPVLPKLSESDLLQHQPLSADDFPRRTKAQLKLYPNSANGMPVSICSPTQQLQVLHINTEDTITTGAVAASLLTPRFSADTDTISQESCFLSSDSTMQLCPAMSNGHISTPDEDGSTICESDRSGKGKAIVSRQPSVAANVDDEEKFVHHSRRLSGGCPFEDSASMQLHCTKCDIRVKRSSCRAHACCHANDNFVGSLLARGYGVEHTKISVGKEVEEKLLKQCFPSFASPPEHLGKRRYCL